MKNNACILKGSAHDVETYGMLLAQLLNAKFKTNCTNKQAFRTIELDIPIMGNPANPHSVTICMRLDNRNNSESELVIEHGIEYIEWQNAVGSLCHCCAFNRGQYRCADIMMNASDHVKSCDSYKFSEVRLKEHLEHKR